MEYKILSGVTDIPVLGLGTWEIGGGMTKNAGNDRESVAAIKKAIELGYTHIDTAEMYGGGHCLSLIHISEPTRPY